MKASASEPAAADHATIAANLSAATGGAAPHHAWRLMAELADATGPGGAADEDEEAGGARVVAAIEAAMALAPRDPLEGMLVAQMAAVHAAAMRCLCRAAACGADPQIEALYLREASRLLHLFQRQAEMLDRRARRLGRPGEDGLEALAAAGDGAAAAGGTDGAAAAGAAGPQSILETILEPIVAELRAGMAEEADAEAQGTEDRDRGSGIRGGDLPIPES